MPIVLLLLVFLFLQQSPAAPPPGNYYPNASYVPPPQPPLIPVSALPPAPSTSTWRPTARPPSQFRGTPPAPPTPPATGPAFEGRQGPNHFTGADAATSPDVIISSLTAFHRGV